MEGSRRYAVAAALVLLALGTCASAEARPGDNSRAQAILSEFIRVIDGILARRAQSIARLSTAKGDGWQDLFDGASLAGWRKTDFSGGADSRVEANFRGGPSAIVIEVGSTLSGLTWTGTPPRSSYEISLDVMKIKGNDFMCGLTFPVAESYASLILGGWGGTVVGVSSVDGADASENETNRSIVFTEGRWYSVRVRVTPSKIEAWLDSEQIVNLSIENRTIGLRPGPISKSVPLGIATYQTSAAYRAIRLRRLP